MTVIQDGSVLDGVDRLDSETDLTSSWWALSGITEATLSDCIAEQDDFGGSVVALSLDVTTVFWVGLGWDIISDVEQLHEITVKGVKFQITLGETGS